MDLGPLYHWSPRDRRESIKSSGLDPRAPRTLTSASSQQDGVCLSPDPATAWAYSHASREREGKFDLWQVELNDNDEVHILPQWGKRIIEVRVAGHIPPGRVRFIAERVVV